MKQVSKNLRMALANYNEMLDFSRFGSDLDKSTQQILSHGAILLEVLKQKQYMPLSLAQEVVDIYIVQQGLLDEVPVNKVHSVLKLLSSTISATYPYIYKNIEENMEISNQDKNQIENIISTIKAGLNKITNINQF